MKKSLLPIFLVVFSSFFGIAQTQIGADIDGEVANDWSGYSVSLSGDGLTTAIGAPLNDGSASNAGQARVFKNISGLWVQQGNDIDGEAAQDEFGRSLSISADGLTLAVGGRSNDGIGTNAGHVKVFKFISGAWVQQGNDIDGEAANDWSGHSVSLSDDGLTLAIGAPLNDGNGSNSGHVRIYEFISGAWVQKGSDINGEAAFDESGWSLSLSSDGLIIAIGAPKNDGNGTSSGHVRVYEFISGDWVQKGSDINGEAAINQSGWSLSLSSDGLIVAIGAKDNGGNGVQSGHVRIYKYTSGAWVQQGNDIDGEAASDLSGTSISLSDDGLTLAIGAPNNDGNGNISGHVRIFKFTGGGWVQEGNDIDGEAAGDELGVSVNVSGDGLTLAVGAPFNDGNGVNSGHVRVHKVCANSTGTDVQTACGTYTWIDGNTYTTSNNAATFILINAAGCDSVVTLDLTINNGSIGTDIQTACDSYTWIDGNTYTSSNNTATFTLTNAEGCDSVVTLNLNINPQPDISTSLSGTTITASQAGALYQWLDCGNTNAPIPNETNQSYTANSSGNYAVEVDLNGCVDTSSCVAVTTVSLFDKDFSEGFIIYPNPTSDIINVISDEELSISLYTADGKFISTYPSNMIDTKGLSQGVYILSIETPKGQKTIQRIVKK